MSYTRVAVYYLPPGGDLARFGASWLGWDVAQGCPAPQPAIAGLAEVTEAPRKYGFHGTLKPPFRLAEGLDIAALEEAVESVARTGAPARADGLALTTLGGFLAFTPVGDAAAIERLAASCVTELDAFRAPAGPNEIARRRGAGLTSRQDALLTRWGYPYVMEEFHFHLTLTGRLPKDKAEGWYREARARLPELPVPFVMEDVALAGERPDGRFELIRRFPLTG
ncbi:DUF1045 domain-containing protein [Roseicyclus sp. F158]|uniref:DUF1045 domain-containing protein n=1 Tax=Tropicimonas omnivorans TaxID=3075590 RepID=A0ABU3DHH9_9RHOB|nr:DUF1045 domain-containing protein [Roseicyclus sp. F158]MDT0683182.1 DUF1045 domain-containing protein [Roseicyclus sp. F158]